MTKTTDFTKTFQDMMGQMPVDTSAAKEAFKSQAVIGEKMVKVALDAAEKSTDITAQWAKQTFAKVSEMVEMKEQPADYAKAMQDFFASASKMASDNMAAFAEVAKKVQMDTVELMLSAGKEAQEDLTAAAKKVGEDVQAAAKKVSAAAAK